jgi:hypothetical protein
MKKSKLKTAMSVATGAMAALALSASAQTQDATTPPPASSSDPLVDLLIKKGILTSDEAKQIKTEMATTQTNAFESMPASKWRISNAIKDIGLFGDLRLRYEYRGVDNAAGLKPDTFYRERFRYALRFGLKGDLYDNFNYGIRLETSTNPRSPWVTFADDSQPTPSDKHSDGLNIGQVYIGWHPAPWYEMTVGRMPMPLYTTPMVWDSDINPEGAFEKFKYSVGDFDLFADFGQFDYQNPSSSSTIPSGDVFILAWQAGANVNISKDMSVKIAPVLYNYTGLGSTNGMNLGLGVPYTGQGNNGQNVNFTGGTAFNQNGINDLLILEMPAEFDFKIQTSFLGPLQGRFFGDFGLNLQGDKRAKAAAAAAGLSRAYTDDTKAYQFGFGIGNAGATYGPTQGLVYGTTSKKNTWEARVYWQHVEQYALDVNLMDSDFFEGRANLEGVYTAFAYSFTDAIIGTLRYGHAHRINNNLGTGGNNLDIPGLNPINNYNLAQFDLTFRF